MIKIIRHLKYAFVTKKQNIFLSLIFYHLNHNKCLKLHPTYYICFNTAAVSTSQKITSLLPEPDNASPLVYETPFLYHYQLQLNCKTLKSN
jgi:hypothetical protein